MASLEHSITTLLQQANAYHIVITRFIFGLGILCKQALASEAHFPAAQCLNAQNFTRVHASSVAPVSTGRGVLQSLLSAPNQEAVFCGEMGPEASHSHLWFEQAVDAPRGDNDVTTLKKGESQS